MVAFLLAVAMAAGITYGSWLFDARLTGNRRSIRIILALVLLAPSAWLSTLIVAAHLLQSPGAYGPIQYWTDAAGNVSFLFHVRVLSMFVLLGCVIVAAAVAVTTIVSLCAASSVPKWRLSVVPAMAIAAFVLAFYGYFSTAFFPTA